MEYSQKLKELEDKVVALCIDYISGKPGDYIKEIDKLEEELKEATEKYELARCHDLSSFHEVRSTYSFYEAPDAKTTKVLIIEIVEEEDFFNVTHVTIKVNTLDGRYFMIEAK